MTVLPGVYPGGVDISRRFSDGLVLRAANDYMAVLEHSSTVVDLDGALNVMIEGFEMRHGSPDSEGFVVSIDRGPGGVWSQNVGLMNNIIHDSYSNDLLKIHAGVRDALIQGNMFYNQGDAEQHIDVNSVTDVVIQDNIFFNDFARSQRGAGATKHFIVVKDSGRADDGLQGSRRIAVRRNVFMNWEGGREALIRVGNDGKPYYEAVDVQIENNLIVANSGFDFDAPVGVSGALRVAFVNNTVVGDLSVGAFGFRAQAKGENPKNEELVFSNNIWSDPGGRMVRFSTGSSSDNVGFELDSNLYWNGGRTVPTGRVVSPSDDANGRYDDPGLGDPGDATPPIWDGRAFDSGSESIREEFVRLARSHAAIPAASSAIDAADARCAPATDILARYRHGPADLGAWEASAGEPRDVQFGSSTATTPVDPSMIPDVVRSVHFGCGDDDPSDLVSLCDPAVSLRYGAVLYGRCVI